MANKSRYHCSAWVWRNFPDSRTYSPCSKMYILLSTCCWTSSYITATPQNGANGIVCNCMNQHSNIHEAVYIFSAQYFTVSSLPHLYAWEETKLCRYLCLVYIDMRFIRGIFDFLFRRDCLDKWRQLALRQAIENVLLTAWEKEEKRNGHWTSDMDGMNGLNKTEWRAALGGPMVDKGQSMDA